MLYPSGAKYAGGWKDGKRHAKGDMTFANGDVYKGNWAENSPNGQGQFIGVTGVQYAGGWKDGKVRTMLFISDIRLKTLCRRLTTFVAACAVPRQGPPDAAGGQDLFGRVGERQARWHRYDDLRY
jgi:hypothetical protein